ncbi:helix-turn-helix transcriptional regulator, partial [Paraburkholderia xenovorans]|uniref:helix-turn-helix transcriptional regulator n=1 Tax=Paraburkholderia xenovorans TaxID=36873 RepID=UPI0038B75187
RAYLLQLIGMICTSHRDMIQALVAARSPARQESVFARLSGYLHAHLSDPSFSAASLAALMSLSSRYVGDLVKRETGKSVVQWITQTRIEEAKRLLRDHRRQIKDIAFEVGYRDEAYFTRRFRQFTGVSPSAYRDGA